MTSDLSRRRPAALWLSIALLLIGAPLLLATAPAAGGGVAFLPSIQRREDCQVAGTSYGSMSTIPPQITMPAESHPDLNLAVRGYAPTQAALSLVSYGPVDDSRAPQLNTLFGNGRLPAFIGAYHRYRWDWSCMCTTDTYSPWGATVLGMAVTPGEVIRTPDSGYDIGGGRDAMVLYADAQRLTLHYARQDDLNGYTIHVEDVCVEPDLVALFRALDDAGRGQLPALRGGQPIGRALSGELKVAVRDTGHFLDPRSRFDWWQNVSP